MAIQFYNGDILFVGGAIAMHADCCCEEPGPCPNCNYDSTDYSPLELLATFTGDAISGSCNWYGVTNAQVNAALSGTHILQQCPIVSAPPGTYECCWYLKYVFTDVSPYYLIGMISASSVSLRLCISDCDDHPTFYATKGIWVASVITDGRDCATFDTDLTWAAGGVCSDGTGTVHLEAL